MDKSASPDQALANLERIVAARRSREAEKATRFGKRVARNIRIRPPRSQGADLPDIPEEAVRLTKRITGERD